MIRLGEGSFDNLMIVDFPSLSPQRLRSEVGRGQPGQALTRVGLHRLALTPVCVDCVPGAMFTMNLFSWLVSSEHEGLSPEWRSYRTRDVGSLSLRRTSVILSGFY